MDLKKCSVSKKRGFYCLQTARQVLQSVFPLCEDPQRRIQCCNQSSHYAKIFKVNTALQSDFLGKKPKRTALCNQSSHYAKTQKVNTALQPVCLGTNPKRTVVSNQSSYYAKTLKASTALQSIFLDISVIVVDCP